MSTKKKEIQLNALELNITERLALPGILPVKGNLTAIIIVDELIGMVKLTSQEIVDFGIQNTKDGKGITWIEEKEKPIVLTLNAAQIDTLKKGVEQADKEEKINLSNLSLIKKIIKL